jgi:hypothetical protein
MWPTCGIEATNSCPQSWHFRSAGRCSLLVGTIPLSGTLLFYLLAHLRSIVRISTPQAARVRRQDPPGDFLEMVSNFSELSQYSS